MARKYPTAAQINRLPKALRDYIHDLETRADPAGDLQRLALAEENVRALTAKIAELQRRRPKSRKP